MGWCVNNNDRPKDNFAHVEMNEKSTIIRFFEKLAPVAEVRKHWKAAMIVIVISMMFLLIVDAQTLIRYRNVYHYNDTKVVCFLLLIVLCFLASSLICSAVFSWFYCYDFIQHFRL